MRIDEIEIRVSVLFDDIDGGEEPTDEGIEALKEEVELHATDEYRLCNLIDFDFEETEYIEKRHVFRAVFKD